MRQPNFNRNRGPRMGENLSATLDASKKSTLLRLFRLVMKHYRWMVLTVFVCIAVSSVTSLASTLFTRTLIDDYIVPLTQVANPEYSSLLQALFKLGLILLLGVICSYTYNRLMIYVSQGTQLRLRKQLFEHMERLPLSYFDSHSHGEMMSTYTNDVDSLRQVISLYVDGRFEHSTDARQHFHRHSDVDFDDAARNVVARLFPHPTGVACRRQWFY